MHVQLYVWMCVRLWVHCPSYWVCLMPSALRDKHDLDQTGRHISGSAILGVLVLWWMYSICR